MAKLRAPLLSGSASGTLGDQLAYYTTGPAAYARSNANRRARRRAGLKTPPTPAQLATRARWSAGITAWHALPALERAAYAAAATPLHLTGFNLFMRDFTPTSGTTWDGGATTWDAGVTTWDN